MYFLKSKFKCFGDDVWTFDSVAEAIHKASQISMPSEEWDVFNEQGVRVAGLVAANNYEKLLSESVLFN